MSFSQPIRCKTKTSRELGSRLFPRLAPAARVAGLDWFSKVLSIAVFVCVHLLLH